LAIHDRFDESKAHLADLRHRALRHHSEGIFLAEKIFGTAITNSEGRVIPVRWVGEQHVKEDLGWIPTVKDWLQHLQPAPWMGRTGRLAIREEERMQGELSHGPVERIDNSEESGHAKQADGASTDQRAGNDDFGLQGAV
jgi:hypothetical protein